MPVDPFREQKISNWAAEFADTREVEAYPHALREYAASVASSFLTAACALRDVEPDRLIEADWKAGLLRGATQVPLPAQARQKVPDFCAAYVEMLQSQGRVAPSRGIPAYLKALRKAFLNKAPHAEAGPKAQPKSVKKQTPITRPGSRLRPNDPCPCGSGKKYKKCCQRLLG